MLLTILFSLAAIAALTYFGLKKKDQKTEEPVNLQTQVVEEKKEELVEAPKAEEKPVKKKSTQAVKKTTAKKAKK